MSQLLHGRLDGLGSADRAALERLARYHTPPERVVGDMLGRAMAGLAARLRRQVGVLIDRRGAVTQVIVGDAHKLDLPDIGRARASKGRLRGLRLVHVHLHGEALSDDDLTDLARLGFDLVAALTLEGDAPGLVHVAHIVPTRPGEVMRDVRPSRALPAAPWPAAEIDAAALVRGLEDELGAAVPAVRMVDARERALIVHVGAEPQAAAEDSLDELAELCRTARVEVLGRIVQRRQQIDPATVLGSGRLQSVILEAMQVDATVLVFDRELSPAQMRGIARATEMKVLDRTQVILDIFASRARSREGQIEVELAQLRYALPRLGSRDDAMSRLTGGIGGVGPGETKLEVDKRRARDRMHRLQQELERLGHGRALRRRGRTRLEAPLVALVGYTNVGKSSLLNALSKADIFVEDLLFATLDPTARRVRLPSGRQVVMTDTVGFIRDLPKQLLGAFRATLEEAADADLLLLVADAAHPQFEAQLRNVEKILADHDVGETPRLVVLNKIDRDHDAATVRDWIERRGALAVSAQSRHGLAALFATVDAQLEAIAAAPMPPSPPPSTPAAWDPLDAG